MVMPMDISVENQRKRTAGDSPEDVGDGDGSDGTDGEESDVSSRLSGQEWDVDSFDGDKYKPRKKIDPNDEDAQRMRRYTLQMYQSNGFNVDFPPRQSLFYKFVIPIDLDKVLWTTGLIGRVYMQNMIDLALERYNRIKGLTVTCVSIVRANACLVDGNRGIQSFITFMARETPDGDLVEYQAKTEQRTLQRKAHAIFCRPAPKPKEAPMDEEYESYSSESSDSDASSRASGQEWDVDSFDDETDYKLLELDATEEEIQKLCLYRRKMQQSKGFYVDGESYSGRYEFFSQVKLDEIYRHYGRTGREYVSNIVDQALEKYNNIKGANVTCESIVRANATIMNGHKLYITFMARESPGGELVEYQAKTEWRFGQRKQHIIFCRPAPKSKDSSC